MQKFGSLALVLLGGLLGLAAIVLVGVNLYVQSQGTQARIQQELRQRFDIALNVQRISVTPWDGLKLSGITIPQGATPGAANFLKARNFGLRVAFFSLFSKQLVIKEVSLVDPDVTWQQNANGKWMFPDIRQHRAENTPVASNEARSAPSETQPELETPGSTATPTPRPARPKQRAIASTKEKLLPPSIVSEVHRIAVTGGNFRFLDRSQNMVANFEDVGFRAALRNSSDLRGTAHVARVSLRDRFFLQQLKSPLRYDQSGLEMPQISARLADGDISGRFSIEPEIEESPFTAQVKFRNVQADEVLTQAGGPSGVVQGKLEGSLDVAGKTADRNALNGSGEILLRDGQVRQYNLLVALGQVLQIEELTQLRLEQAQAKYHISPGLVTIDELILRSPNIHLSAAGTVTFGGKLHLNSHLAINEKIRAQLFKPMRTNFHATDEPGYSAVEFEVGGTLERPKTNLLEKVVGRDLKDLVNSFWGGKGDRPKKKKSAEATQEESPSVTPTATPAAGTSPAAIDPTTAGSP